MNGKDFDKWHNYFNDVIREIAREEEVTLVDFENTLEDKSEWMYDYVHYNTEGSKVASEMLYETIKPLLVLE